MMKIILMIVMIFVTLHTNMYAFEEKLALELARAKKLDLVIKRVNTIYEYINLYVLQTALKPANITALASKYPGIVTTGFRNTSNIDFSISSSNIVTFTGVVPNNLSTIIRQIYINSPSLHPNASVNTINLDMDIRLKPESVKFLSNVAVLKAKFNLLLIQESDPVCNAAKNGKVWYQPDVQGGFYIQYCNGNVTPPASPQWITMSNNLDIALYRSTAAQLAIIQPPVGTKAYTISPTDPNVLSEYIFTGIGGTLGWKPVKY